VADRVSATVILTVGQSGFKGKNWASVLGGACSALLARRTFLLNPFGIGGLFSMLERAWLLLYLFKLVNTAEDAVVGRAPAASLATTLGVATLGSERIIELSIEAPDDLINRRRIWRTQSVGKAIKSEIVLKHVQSRGVVLSMSQTICPVNHLFNHVVVQRREQIVSFSSKSNLVFVLLLVLPVEKDPIGVNGPRLVDGQKEPRPW
jgi:hypothetical protein